MVHVSAVATAVRQTLTGLDPDLIEFISSGICEGEDEVDAMPPREDLRDLVVPLLEEVCGGDDDKATAMADSLWQALTGGSGDLHAVEVAPVALKEAVRVGGDEPKAAARKPEEAAALATDSKAVAAQAKAEAAVEAKRRAAKQQMARSIEQLAEELRGARLAVAKRRAEIGAPREAAVVVRGLVLPNPGGGANLLEEASMTLVPGHRYGLIGRNGKGKSTLLQAIAARRVPGLPDNLSTHYVSQDVNLMPEQEDQVPAEIVVEADIERRLLIEEQETLQGRDMDARAAERLVYVEERLVEIEAATADERADRLLIDLGFPEHLRRRPMRELSGGWRVRTCLAAALFGKPDMLLLDEPTNHLSIYAVLWLIQEISTNPVWASRIVMMVSHDRAFLDECCTHTLHISGAARILTQHKGGYAVWAARRAEQQKAWKRAAALRAEKRKTLVEYTQHGFKYGGSSGQIAMQQKKLKEIEKLDVEAEAEAAELADLQEDDELPLKLEAGGELDKPVVQLDAVSFGYTPDAMLFTDVNLRVDSKSRITVIGENGAGKTTLVRIILGQLEPVSGSVRRAGGSRVEVVTQHHSDQLDLDVTPLQFMHARFPGDGTLEHDQRLRGHLAACGVDAHLQMTLARGLSGGQRSRVAMAATSFTRPHVLVMDEPTNNLDLEAVDALAQCVETFEGGVVLVSHDSWFVERVAKEVVLVEGGRVTRCESFKGYKKSVLAKFNKQAQPS